MSVIAVQDLTKRFGSVTAVDGATFEVDRGTVVGFLGPNGAGKTTTLRMLLGLVAPTGGTATIHGRPYRDLDDPMRQVGASLEASSFHPARTGRNHLRWLARAGEVDERRVDEVLDLVDLTEAADRRTRGYSMGMRQRLGLAAALLGDPGVLLLDEPANGLDPEGIRWLRQFLRRLAGEGRTVLVSSHVLAEVAQTVDQVVIIARGRVVAQAPLDELTRRAGGAVRVRTPQAEALHAALVERGVDARIEGDRVVAPGATSEVVGGTAAATGVVVYEIGVEQVDLEDVFLQLTGGRGLDADRAERGAGGRP